MLTILLVALLAYMRVGAIPISPVPTANLAVYELHPRCDCSGTGAEGRTIYAIVKSCLFTIAACVYRAVHQNIPDPELGFWGRLRVTTKVTLCALIAPELIVWWAMRQWFGARDVVKWTKKAEPKLKWTNVHGQFAQMGGFAPKDNKQVLRPDTLGQLLRNGRLNIEELQLTEKEILDKSKGDILSKTLVASQTTWFVFECIARLQQGLPLIELEVVTLAFATLNSITYALWWYKPLNILCPIYIQVLPKASDPSNSNFRPEPLGASNAVAEMSRSWREIERTNQADSGEGLAKTPTGVVGRIVAVIKGDIQEDGWWRMLWKRLIKQPFSVVTLPLKELVEEGKLHEDAPHVSTFFAEDISTNNMMLVQALNSFIGMVFGAIHFLSWHATFPTHVELVLWRTSSVVLVVPPFFLLLHALAIHIFIRDWNMFPRASTRPLESLADFFGTVFQYISFFGGPIPYILARFCVLVLAFLTLHDLPADALTNISWTSYIPHI
ncbi:hypothetical protein BDN72DRAFT_847830 [Pluteus cervinus]|uniref:Uncharacterized protein n=1 Tax=Pluteus cervinus TaxID=181527 RepID=A0ACD3AC77_9AGAR|nr:hypothetical protein BDN72DRAFT_847830 [Pluteus cervinus]